MLFLDGSGGGIAWRELFEAVVVVLAMLDTEGVLLPTLGLSVNDFVRVFGSVLGGKAGNSHSPHAGALTLGPLSSDFVLDAVTRGPL